MLRIALEVTVYVIRMRFVLYERTVNIDGLYTDSPELPRQYSQIAY